MNCTFLNVSIISRRGLASKVFPMPYFFFPSFAKPIFSLIHSKTNRVIPFLARFRFPMGAWTRLHLSLESAVGGCNASSADLRLEEAVPGSTSGVGASRRRPHRLTHLPLLALSRLEEARHTVSVRRQNLRGSVSQTQSTSA